MPFNIPLAGAFPLLVSDAERQQAFYFVALGSARRLAA